MALADGRRIVMDGCEYEWVVRRRGNEFRLVAQDVAARGQLLVARFPVYVLNLLNESHGEFYTRTRITPERLREAIGQALDRGWLPAQKGLPPFRMGSAGGWGLEHSADLRLVEGLWTVLDAIGRDPDWRARLARNTGEFVPVPSAFVRNLDPALEASLAAAGPWAVYIRDFDHGDAVPHLAIRSLAWNKDLVLEDVAGWHQGWRRADLGD